MENGIIDRVKGAIHHWWISLLVGILWVGFGFWCMATPLETFLALTLFFVCGFLVSGVSDIVFALANRKHLSDWGWTLAIGSIDVLFAVSLLAKPGLAAAVLVYYLIFWLLFRSSWGIGISIYLSRYKDSGWGWLLLYAALGMIFSVVLLCQPVLAGLMVSYLFAGLFLLYGVFRIVLSFKLKKLHKILL